jgi:hypothetical protein
MGKPSKTAGFRCHFCGSKRVRRVHRRGFVEHIFLPFLRLRPFECIDCDKRFYSHAKAMGVQQHEPPVMAARPQLLQDQPVPETTIPANCVPVERRSFTRLNCQIPARVVVGSEPCITGIVSGLSLSGCFIETPNTVPVGSEIELSLEVGAGAHSRGLVRRSLQARGMGVEFILMTVPNFRRLQSIAKNSVSSL